MIGRIYTDAYIQEVKRAIEFISNFYMETSGGHIPTFSQIFAHYKKKG
jgi:hypothetical protein